MLRRNAVAGADDESPLNNEVGGLKARWCDPLAPA
jgi:hypothetical protein